MFKIAQHVLKLFKVLINTKFEEMLLNIGYIDEN